MSLVDFVIGTAVGGFGGFFGSMGGYRPSSWGGSAFSQEAMLLTVPNVGGIYFDAVLSYDETQGVTFTSHPVQCGADISDHGFLNPITVNMEVACSNAMAYRSGFSGYAMNTGDKALDALQSLLLLMKTKQPITIVGVRGIHKNMVVESVEHHEDASTGEIVRINISLKEILLAEVSTEKASARDWTTGDGANRGEVQGVEEPGSIISEVRGDGETGLRNQ